MRKQGVLIFFTFIHYSVRLYFIIFCQIVFTVALYSQSAKSELNLNNLNTGLLEQLFVKKLNALRAEQGAGKVGTDKTLQEAALDQAKYMASVKKVLHSQKSPQKQTPLKRVQFYKGTHGGVGENCLQIYLKRPMKDKKTGKVTVVNTYEEAADELYDTWFNSPGHYQNMIDRKYDLQGLGIFLTPDSALYAAEVFSAKPYIPIHDKEIRDTAYGVLPPYETVCKACDSKAGREAIASIAIVQEGDSIFMKSENLPALKAFFNHPRDGIYLDLVLRNQYTCDNNHLLHGSEVYEGTMLKPANFFELYKKNRARDGKNLYAFWCKIPAYFHNKNYHTNLAYVKQGYSCRYTYVKPVPNDNLEMLDLIPKYILQRDLELSPDSFAGSLKLLVPFERGSTAIKQKSKKAIIKSLSVYEPYLKHIQINTYSSVEGNSESNIKLQQQRAAEIETLIRSVVHRNVSISSQSKENWDDFYKHIQNSPFAYLKNLSTGEIKQRLTDKALLDSINDILAAGRVAEILVELQAQVNNSSPPELILGSYKNAAEREDSAHTFRSQNKLIEAGFKDNFNSAELLQVRLPKKRKFLPMWSNYLAISAMNADAAYSYNVPDSARKMLRVDSTYVPLQFNFCILALKYLHYYYDTILPLPQLEHKMTRAFDMAKGHKDSSLVNHMWLNYHLLSLHRAWAKHQYDKLDRHLLGAKQYYPGAEISVDEAVRLGLLFNLYHRYGWTTELMLPYIKKYPEHEDALFLFVQSYIPEEKKVSEDEWIGYIRRAKKMNAKRFQDWIDKDDFQDLRREEIKKEFCGR